MLRHLKRQRASVKGKQGSSRGSPELRRGEGEAALLKSMSEGPNVIHLFPAPPDNNIVVYLPL